MADFKKNTWVEVNGWKYPTFVFGNASRPGYVNVYTSSFLGPNNSVEEHHESQLSMIDAPSPFDSKHEPLIDKINDLANAGDYKRVWEETDKLMEYLIEDNHPEYHKD